MEALKPALKKILTGIHKNIDVYTTLLMVFSYHLIYTKDFTCSCKPEPHQWNFCNTYLFLPWILICFLLLWMDKVFRRACHKWAQLFKTPCCSQIKACLLKEDKTSHNTHSSTSSGPSPEENGKCSVPKEACCHITFCSGVIHFFRALSVSAMWMVSVLVEGDWFVCCRNSGTATEILIACKNVSTMTPEEESTASKLKNQSRVWAIIVLGLMALILTISSCCTCIWQKQTTFADLIMEKEEELVLESVNKAAEYEAKKLSAQIREDKWRTYITQGVNLIDWKSFENHQASDSPGGGASTNSGGGASDSPGGGASTNSGIPMVRYSSSGQSHWGNLSGAVGSRGAAPGDPSPDLEPGSWSGVTSWRF